MTYDTLPEHVQDSPEWHEARRSSLGASEVAAVLGLSPWQTPLTVWRAKVLGEVNEIDPEASFHGHRMEPVIADWIRKFHPEVGPVSDGMSILSGDCPWLTATPDRMAGHIPIELKTARRAWEDGVPDYYRVQSLVQQGILGAEYGWVAVNFGAGPNRYELYRIDFDPIAWEQIVRITGEWWQAHVVEGVAPDPVTSAEAAELWPGDEAATIEGDERLYELWETYGLMQAEQVEVSQQLDAVKLELQKAMKDAVALTYQGRELFTWKPRKGATRWDTKALEADMPELADKYKVQGAPTRTFLRKTVKEVEA